MGSLNVMIEALKTLQGDVDAINDKSSSTYDIIQTISDEISAPIVAAIRAINITTTVDMTSVISAINSMSSAIQSSVSSMDEDLRTHIDYMNTTLLAAIQAKNTITQYTTATKFSSSALAAGVSVVLIPANPLRKGFSVYNNSTNSMYICLEDPAVAANLIDFCGSNAGPTSVVKWIGPGVPTGKITGIRNAGTGGWVAWEFT